MEEYFEATMLHSMAPMLKYNLADDGFGNLCVVSASAWAAAWYHIKGLYPSQW